MGFLKEKYNILLILLILVTLLKGLLWVIFTPIFQGPDEQRHYLYIQYLAEFNKPPKQDIPYISYEVAEVMDLVEFGKTIHTGYKQLFTNNLVGLNEERIKNLDPDLRRINSGGDEVYRTGSAQIYPPAYYYLGAKFYQLLGGLDFYERFYGLRLLLLILPALSIFFCYLVALEFFSKKFLALTAATLMSFLPQYSFISSVLNNDNLLILTITIFIYICLRIINRGLNYSLIIWLGIISGLSLLTKPQAVVIIFFGSGALFFILKRWKKINIYYLLKSLVLFALIVLAISGWWFFLNYINYHSWLGLAVSFYHQSNNPSPHSSPVYLLGFLILYFFQLSFSFFGEFGWADVVLADWYYILFDIFALSSLAVFSSLIWKKKIIWPVTEKIFFCIMCGLPLFLVVTYLFLSSIYHTGYIGLYSQARTFFPLLSIFFALFLLPLQCLPIIQRGKNILCLLLICFFVTANYASLFYYLISYYYV